MFLSNGLVRTLAASPMLRPSILRRWSSSLAITSLSVPTWLLMPQEFSSSMFEP